jgi:hypothetical protein
MLRLKEGETKGGADAVRMQIAPGIPTPVRELA